MVRRAWDSMEAWLASPSLSLASVEPAGSISLLRPSSGIHRRDTGRGSRLTASCVSPPNSRLTSGSRGGRRESKRSSGVRVSLAVLNYGGAARPNADGTQSESSTRTRIVPAVWRIVVNRAPDDNLLIGPRHIPNLVGYPPNENSYGSKGSGCAPDASGSSVSLSFSQQMPDLRACGHDAGPVETPRMPNIANGLANRILSAGAATAISVRRGSVVPACGISPTQSGYRFAGLIRTAAPIVDSGAIRAERSVSISSPRTISRPSVEAGITRPATWCLRVIRVTQPRATARRSNGSLREDERSTSSHIRCFSSGCPCSEGVDRWL